MKEKNFYIKIIPARETRELRQLILRPHQSADELVYPGDEDKDTVHFGLICGDKLAGISSLYKQKMKDSDEPEAWRLRGMATAENFRGIGFGKELMYACIKHIENNKGKLFWCNARTTAEMFYEKFGMRRYGEVFYPEDLGAHIVMMMKF